MLRFRSKTQQPEGIIEADMSSVSKDKRKTSLLQSTTIVAPVTIVWESLTNIVSWQWNRSVRLDASCVIQGKTGKSQIVLGRSRVSSTFKFGNICRRSFTFTWITKCKGYESTNTIQLRAMGSKVTKLTHTQTFEGKPLFFRVPYKKHEKAIRVMNQGLKNHVESLYFNTLLSDFSHSGMLAPGTGCALSSSTDMTVVSDMSSSTFWDTPKHIRQKLVESFMEREIDSEQMFDA